MTENLDIVSLIEKNPLTRLSGDYNSKFIEKIQSKFTNDQQQLFVASFYCYLNYNTKDDFTIDLDNVWKWLGFTRKDPAKRLLEKHFVENIDYKILLLQHVEHVHGGCNKETITMSILTFKKLCLKAATKKSDEIHDYYIKLEELLHDTMNEESQELRLQLQEKEQEIVKIKKKNKLIEKRWYNTDPGDVVYVFNNNNNDENASLINIGKSKNIAKREINYLGSNQNGSIVYVRKCHDCHLAEKVLHHILDKYREQNNAEWFDISQDLAVYIVDITCTFLDSFIGYSDNLLNSGVKEGLDIALTKLKELCPNETTIETSLIKDPTTSNNNVTQASHNEILDDNFEKFIKECCDIGNDYQVHPYDLIGGFLLWNKRRIIRSERTRFNNYMKNKFKLNLVYVEKFDTNLCLHNGIKMKEFTYKSSNLETFTYFDEFFNDQCHTGYTFKISCSEFYDEYSKWLKVHYPDYILDKQEIINLKYFINKQFLFEKISIPGHTNVDGILGFQLKSNPNPRYGILLSRRKSIKQTDMTTNQITHYKSLTSASRILNISVQELSSFLKSNILVNNCTLEYE